MAEQPTSERSIFLAAMEIGAAADRAAYLEEACAGDERLRGDVEALIAAHERLPPSPGAAGLETLERPILINLPGEVIGRYKLLETIGEGGHGTVYMAEQTSPVQRKVALKIIKAGMDTRQVIARFEAERQALALMDHPNIAKVFDAGVSETGRPYFVMELVKGVPITRYCDEKRLTPRERLELFVQVCQAVQHAHQKGIIHRDLKPSNVLVALYDGKPVPKIIDFGVAKATGQRLTEKTMFTGFGDVIGTPEYMSPEQAELNQLDIDTRSDIYSLGVLLYELLTGSPPFSHKELEKAGILEMLRVIREREPTKPSTKLSTAEGLPTLAANRSTEPARLTKLVRGDLDWIVMKALEKDRSQRYETANGLAMDVQRYLKDEPVQACPPSAAYRLRKFVRRNKRSLTMVAIVAGAILVSVGTIGWMVRDRAAREQKIAQDRSTRQTLIRERVTLELEDARNRHQEGRWKEALDAAKRAEALVAAGETDEETRRRAREVLGDMLMLANLENVRVRSTQNEAGFDLKQEDSGNARAFAEYGIDIDALGRDEAAARIRARSIRHELAVLLDSWSHVRRRLAEQGSKPIGKDWKELLEVAQAADPDPWRDRFRKAVLDDDRKALVELAASAPLSSLPAETVDRLGDALMGMRAIEEATAFLKKGQRFHPQDYWINANLGLCLLRLSPQQLDEAIRYFTAAVALRPEAAQSHSNLGDALKAQGKLDEAIACYRKAIEIQPRSAFAHWYLGQALQRNNKLDEAVAAYRTAIELDPSYGFLHNSLGLALQRNNKLDEAVAAYSKAIEVSPRDAGFQVSLGRVLLLQNKPDEAVAAFRAAVELDPKEGIVHNSLGLALESNKQLDEAVAAYRKAIELHPRAAGYHVNLGRVLLLQKKLDEARAVFRTAAELEPTSTYAHRMLGLALRDQEMLDEAVAVFRSAIERFPEDATLRDDLGVVLQRNNKPDEAAAAFRKATELDPKYALSYMHLGHALKAQGKQDEAIVAFRKAIELEPQNAQPHNLLAWLLATCSEAKLRDPSQSVILAKKAVELAPMNPDFSNTLGVAHYRTGDWKAAIAALQKSMELRKGGGSIDWFFLAMAHWRLGEEDKARECYDKAVAWMDKNQPEDEELRRFRTEAEELMKVAGKGPATKTNSK